MRITEADVEFIEKSRPDYLGPVHPAAEHPGQGQASSLSCLRGPVVVGPRHEAYSRG